MNFELILSMFFLIFSSFLIFLSAELLKYGPAGLSPGLFPMIVSTLLLILSLFWFFSLFKKKGDQINNNFSKGLWKLLVTIILTFAFIFLVPYIHFFYATILYVFILSILSGQKNLLLNLIISFLSSAVIFFIFGKVLNVALP